MESEMKIGVALNMTARPGLSDSRTIREHLSLALLAESLGYDSVFITEHHFSDYALTPSPFQLLAYLAARTERILLGTAVVVVPWHNPLRLAEEMLVLESLSPGRTVFGFGRGAARAEYDGLGVPPEESEGRFADGLRAVAAALERSGGSEQVPEEEGAVVLRPRPDTPLRLPLYTASTTGQCGAVAAELGLRQLVSGQADSAALRAQVRQYQDAVAQKGGTPAPPAVLALATSLENGDEARSFAYRFLNDDWDLVDRHYGYSRGLVSRIPGYEKHRSIETHFQRLHSCPEYRRNETKKLVRSQLIGSAEDCLRKFTDMAECTGTDHMILEFCYGGMPLDEVRRSMVHFAEEVLPRLR